MELNQIGFFQFDNLVQGRVPFYLLDLNTEIAAWYKGMAARHLENITIPCTPDTALPLIEEKKLPPHFALVVLDKDETQAPAIAQKLEAAGFTNVFLVKGGILGMAKERNSE